LKIKVDQILFKIHHEPSAILHNILREAKVLAPYQAALDDPMHLPTQKSIKQLNFCTGPPHKSLLAISHRTEQPLPIIR
jgi:hypothetical protein